jgi:hypothetical protein
MPRVKRYVAVASVNVVILAVLLELAGVATHYARERRAFYGRPSPEWPQVATVEPAGTQFVLHPIMGFIRRPGLSITSAATRDRLDAMVGAEATPEWTALRANNFGFFSRRDYPYTPEDEPYLVGIFGGSVAQWFALQGASVLVDRLRQAVALKDRRIEILNFAQGGFKQPQQLQALAYFLARRQPLDFVVNIDGFNDVALSSMNVQAGIDPSQPSAQQLLPLVSLLDANALRPERVEAFARAKRSERWMRSMEQRMDRTRSAGAWLVLQVLWQGAAHSFNVANDELGSDAEDTPQDLLHVNPWPAARTPETSMDDIVSTWMQSSMLMHDMLCARGIPYLHVVQPNQYFSKKRFSDEERRVAIRSDSPYANGVRMGYPSLRDRIPAMRALGLDVVSAVEVFDDMERTVYADDCCHVNQLGNEVLARFVGDHIAQAIATTPCHSGR